MSRASNKHEGLYIIPSLTGTGAAYLMHVDTHGKITTVCLVFEDEMDTPLELTEY